MAVVLVVLSLPRPQLYDAVSRCSFHRWKTMPRIAGLKWIRTWVNWQSNHGLLAERYRNLQLLIHVMIYLRPISDSGGNCCGYETAEIVGLQKNGICYIVIPKLKTPLGFQNRFLVTGISTPLGESLAIHSCAKVVWSLGAASLSMTGWDLGWLPHEVGGLKDFSG